MDVVFNVLGYLPVGGVLATLPLWPAVGAATALSTSTEALQLFAKGRSSTLLDIVTNVCGAIIGWSIGRRRRFVPLSIRLTRRYAALALALALADSFFASRLTPHDVEHALNVYAATVGVAGAVNRRGAGDPGELEAHWKFDRNEAGEQRAVLDASGNHLNGTLVNGAIVDELGGRALRLNGVNQYVDFGNTRALRLTGSLTVAAWINSTSFPTDDAAVVSSLSDHELGYQLDTTVDQGSRTIGFKLGSLHGYLMARYGNTPLQVNAWYHAAGVYDARAKTLNVYLNGRPDNGCLLGTVTSAQAVSPANVYVGSRGGEGFEFAGAIRDVRIYSRALSEDEVRAILTSTESAALFAPGTSVGGDQHQSDSKAPENECPPAEPADARIAGVIVFFGVLLAVATAGFWPAGNYRLSCLIISLAAGLPFYHLLTVTLPAYYGVAVPLLTLAGGASVVVSTRPDV